VLYDALALHVPLVIVVNPVKITENRILLVRFPRFSPSV
jgi:hypothetical protein